MATIKIKLHEGGSLPEKHGDMTDLALKQGEVMSKGEVRILPLGVSMELPDGMSGLLVPRSSTCLKHKIIMANSVGIVENSYHGDNDEWGFVAYAVEDTVIPKGTRVCQFTPINFEQDVKFEVVESLGNPDRGGYGSTGESVTN